MPLLMPSDAPHAQSTLRITHTDATLVVALAVLPGHICYAVSVNS